MSHIKAISVKISLKVKANSEKKLVAKTNLAPCPENFNDPDEDSSTHHGAWIQPDPCLSEGRAAAVADGNSQGRICQQG